MEAEYTLSGSGNGENRTFAFAFVFCLACHVLVFLGLVFMPNLSPARRINPTAIPVRMVSLPPDLPSAGPAPQPEPTPEVAPEPPPPEPEKEVEVPPEPPKPKKITPKVVKPEVVPKPDAVSLTPKKSYKKKKSLKKKTYDKAKLKKIQDKAKQKAKDDKLARQKNQALARIKKDAAKAPARQVSGNGAGGSNGGVDPGTLKLIELYSLEVQSIIAQNWAFSGQMARLNNDVKAVIIVKIARNGTISRVMWETKSGNSFLDESAEKAIRKSDPLPPLPPSWKRPYFDLAVGFTPQGLSG